MIESALPTNYLPKPRVAMLELLSQDASGPRTFAALHRAAGITRTLCIRHLTVLRDRHLVDLVRAGTCKGPALYAINALGRLALTDHHRAAAAQTAMVAPPPTFNTHGTPYEPPPRSYYRNEGNKHIASAGVGC